MRENVITIPAAGSGAGHRVSERRRRGTVRWYSSEKGYGFIASDGVGEDVFVRYTDIAMEGFKALTEGQRVLFVLGDDGRGPVALAVQPLESAVRLAGSQPATIRLTVPSSVQT